MIINAPLLLVIRNRWDLAVTFTDASGNPIDLTVTPPFAEFYRSYTPGIASPLDLRVGNGITLGARGVAIVSLLGAVTGSLTAASQKGITFPNRFEIGLLDGTGEKTTLVLQPVTPLDPASIDATQVGLLNAPASVAVTVPTIAPTQVAVGIPGVAGPSGAEDFTAAAAVAISAHTVVMGSQAAASPCDPSAAANATRVLGISHGSAVQGGSALIRQVGILSDPSLNLSPGLPVFCGPGGALIQTVPASPAVAFLLQVGTALTPTSILVALQPPILLA